MFMWRTVLQPTLSVTIYCPGSKQWGNEEQMGSCKWRFDTWCIGIQEGGGSGGSLFLCHSPAPSSLPKHRAYSLYGAAPLTHPHLLVPRPDIVALLQPRLVNTETRFSSVSPIVFVLMLASDNTQNINTSIRAQAELAIIMTFWWPVGDFSLLWFILLQHNQPVVHRQSVNLILMENSSTGLHLTSNYLHCRLTVWLFF